MNPEPRVARASMQRWAAGWLVAMLAGCAVGPNHVAPEVPSAEQHRGDESGDREHSLSDLPWWELYLDPTLVSLIREATEKAYDLRIALARVDAARQSHQAAIWALAPTIGLNAGAGAAVGTPSIPSLYPPEPWSGRFGAAAVASWEADLYGRLRRIAEVAEYEFEASDEDRRGVYIGLVGDVAELYFTLSYLDEQREYAIEAIRTREETLKLFQERSSGGVGNDLEVARARASLEQAKAQMTLIDLQVATSENALSFLLARSPGPIERRTAIENIALPPSIPAGLPSSLLERRPDVRVAEKSLLAANAQIGAEKADFFPKFELTGFAGVVSPDLTEAQAAYGGAAAFSWTLPVLGGQRVRSEYKAAIAQWEGATAYYERVAINAFREVADALANVSTLRARHEALAAQMKALVDAEQLAVSRYRGGVADYLDVLTTQEALLFVQLDIANVRGRQHIAVARLYRTLGGGWLLPPEEDEDKKRKGKNDDEPTEAKNEPAPAASPPA